MRQQKKQQQKQREAERLMKEDMDAALAQISFCNLFIYFNFILYCLYFTKRSLICVLIYRYKFIINKFTRE